MGSSHKWEILKWLMLRWFLFEALQTTVPSNELKGPSFVKRLNDDSFGDSLVLTYSIRLSTGKNELRRNLHHE